MPVDRNPSLNSWGFLFGDFDGLFVTRYCLPDTLVAPSIKKQ